MQYRNLGKSGKRVSALGFGCMRLPLLTDGAVDEAESARMVRFAIDHGVNYLDTAYNYLNGQSEPVVGRILQEGYRDKVTLATKLPVREVKTPADFDRIFNHQRERLQTDHIDVYLLHGLRASRWAQARDLGIRDWLDKQLADGTIGVAGFSFHDSFSLFKEIIDSYPHWGMCQVQYNYMNTEFQAGTRGVRYAASKGLGVVVMEPLLGGRLANPPAAVKAVWQQADEERSPVDWALQWVWDQPEVSVALSGMNAFQQVVENLASADRSGVAQLSTPELALYDKVVAAYDALQAVPCTGCAYCMPCPNGVDIPRTFATFNAGVTFDMADARKRYVRLMPDQTERVLASSCIQCRVCEEKCPQSIPISEWMPVIHAILAEGAEYIPANCPPGQR
jgi:hypothetical protein